MNSYYQELEQWFSGEALNEFIEAAKNQKVAKYPIRVNPPYGFVLKHAYALFGDFPDEIDGPLVDPYVKTNDGEVNDNTKRLSNVLYQMWTENNGGALQIENGIMSQIYGGCIFRLAWDPLNPLLTTKIRIETIRPYEFIAIPRDGDFWTLNEAWIVKKISARTAKQQYGVEISTSDAYYIEHWLPNQYEITVNDSPIGITYGDEIFKIGGENPFGFVPMVYIPHVRHKNFYGDSMIQEAIKGLTREYNARLADGGDAVSEDTHQIGVMSNVRGTPSIIEPIPGLRLLNIGSNQQLVGSDVEPKIDFPVKQKATESVIKLSELLYDQLRREAFVPAVAEGEDEGSQRSSVTLTTRMYPLVSHIKQERALWSTGLRVLHRMAFSMMAIKGVMDITDNDTKMRFTSKWYPVLPRDREQIVNELSVRAANHIGSPEHLLYLAGDIDNIDQQMEQIKEWITFLEETKRKTALQQTETQIKADKATTEMQVDAQKEQEKTSVSQSRQTIQQGVRNANK